MEIIVDSYKIEILIDGESYTWMQPEGEGYWDGDEPSNVPDELWTKLDKIYNSAFN